MAYFWLSGTELAGGSRRVRKGDDVDFSVIKADENEPLNIALRNRGFGIDWLVDLYGNISEFSARRITGEVVSMAHLTAEYELIESSDGDGLEYSLVQSSLCVHPVDSSDAALIGPTDNHGSRIGPISAGFLVQLTDQKK